MEKDKPWMKYWMKNIEELEDDLVAKYTSGLAESNNSRKFQIWKYLATIAYIDSVF